MNKLIGVWLAAGLAAASLSVSLPASGVELGEQDRADLRQRAQEFQNQRERNPDFQPGEGRATPQPADMSDKRSKRTAKPTTATSAQKETRREKVKRKARSIKKIPGAFVRGR